MNLSTRILGRSVVTYLTERQQATVLKIGRDSFDRSVLAGVACFNFTAAANLSKIVNAELNARDTRDVFENIAPARFAIRGLGAVSLAVLGAAFEAKGLGGAAPLESWFNKHQPSTVTFATLKQHEQQTDDAPRSKPRRAPATRRAGRRSSRRVERTLTHAR